MGGSPWSCPLLVLLTWVVPPPLVLALFAKVLQVVPLTLVWVLWEQLGLVFLLDLSVWKQLDPLVVLQLVPLDEVASGEVALFLKVPPTLVWVLWVLWEQRSRARGCCLSRVRGFCFSWSCWCCWCTWSGAAGSRAAGAAGSSWGSWGSSHHGILARGSGHRCQHCSSVHCSGGLWPTAGASPGYWHPQ